MELAEVDLVLEQALTTQVVEVRDGFASANPSLRRLATELSAVELRDLIHTLRGGPMPHRQLAARLLKDSALPVQTVVAEARNALMVETEPAVVRWLVSALGSTRGPTVLRDLRMLASHPSSEVRFQVPDALSACAAGVFDRVADELLALSQDPDDDVRWSAAYELVAWFPEAADDRIQARLTDLAASDEVPGIRALATEGLESQRRL